MIKQELDLPLKSMRVFNHIFNDKQKNQILDEALYFSNIYTTISIERLVQYSINKYIKIKIYKRSFTDIHKNVDEFHSVVLAEYHKNHR